MAATPYISLNKTEKITTTTTGSNLESLRANAFFTGQLKPLLKQQYGVFLWDTEKQKVLERPGLNPGNPKVFPEYFFSVAPKVYEMSDPFSSKVVPTQRGGKFVESHGSIIKSIRVQGTTGVRPNVEVGQFTGIPLVGSALDQLKGTADVFKGGFQERSIPVKEQTGFDDILFLRNIFRAYSDYRENNEFSNNIIMVWYNAKEGDSWIVEPKEFKITRNSASPLLYNYNIIFQTLAPIGTILQTGGDDPLQAILDARRIFSRVQEYNTALKNTFLIVSTQVRRLEGLGIFAETQLLSPIINVTRGLGIIRATASTFGSRLRHNTLVLLDKLDEATALLSGTPGVEPQDALVRSLRRTQITAARILAEPGVRSSVSSISSAKKTRYTQAYIKGGTSTIRARRAPNVGASTAFIGNSAATSKVSQDFVHVGEDIRAIAGRLLRDKAQWHVLATINSLSSPYISDDGRAGTLKAGDTILYPSSSAGFNSSTINTVNISNDETEGKDRNTLGPVQQAYGRDIRLVSVSTSIAGVDLADFTVNQQGDLSSIVGIPNVEQATIVKFSTEKGELPAHPNFGSSFSIGSKATSFALNDFRIQTEATILSDSRITGITSINFTTLQDTLVVKANLVLTNTSDSFNTSISLRRL